MALTPGTKLGPYQIVAPIGAGGMGEVYRATDTRLERSVAVKVLPAQFSADPVRKERFEREAKTISNLNHPHICVLHDVGHQDGIDYLVMECVEGETLAKRLEKGLLPLEQVLKYGAQIADALDKAHRSGVVHRDLKPGNIILTPSGAKLLDFGLAKPAAPVLSAATLTAAATPRSPMTEEGTIVGTFQYMSPEQVEGKEVDGRSDIFSLGAVLYEMLTGKRAFEGKSQLSVASSILEKDPKPISSLQPTSPPALDHVISRALAKTPAERWQSAADIKAELEWIKDSPAQPPILPAAPTGRRRERIAWATSIVLGLMLVSLLFLYWREANNQPVLRVTLLPPEGAHFAMTIGHGAPALSPDGTRIAFVAADKEGKDTIWIRRLDQVEATQLAGTDGGYFPFWSPDGNYIAFFSNGHLWKATSDGGPPVALADVQQARGGSWGQDGTIIFTPNIAGPVMHISASGGVPAPAVKAQPQFGSQRWPFFLPDGKHFLYLNAISGTADERNELRWASIGGEDKLVLKNEYSGRYAQGRLFFVRGGVLTAQPFDPLQGSLSGDAETLATQAGTDIITGNSLFSVSGAGQLIYAPATGAGGDKLAWFDRTGKQVGTVGEPSAFDPMRLSPDGTQLAIIGNLASTGNNVWLFNLRRGTQTRLSLLAEAAFAPVWSPDSKTVYFVARSAAARGELAIYRKPADGSAPEQPIWHSGFPYLRVLDVTPDGKELVLTGQDSGGADAFYVLPLLTGAKPQPFLSGPGLNDAFPGRLSADGRWFAYNSNESGAMQVYVTSFPKPGPKYQVSLSGGTQPVWSRDGKTLYFLDTGRNLMAVDITVKGGALEAGPPVKLFATKMRASLIASGYDVTREGRFLVNTSGEEQSVPAVLVVNWAAGLKK